MFFSPMQLFKAPQWWSNPRTQTLHVRQCELLFGLNILHVSQYLLLFVLLFALSSSSSFTSSSSTTFPSSIIALFFDGRTIPGSVTIVNAHVDRHKHATIACNKVVEASRIKSKTTNPRNAHKEHVEKTHTGATNKEEDEDGLLAR
jgi:hypothetical protein